MSRIKRIYDTKTAKFKEIRDTVDEIYEANSRVTGKAPTTFTKSAKFTIIGHTIEEI